MSSYHEAQLRQAKYYVSTLTKVDTLYIEGGIAIDQGLSLFDIEQHNLERFLTISRKLDERRKGNNCAT
jgi:hypothetical protein